MTRRAQPDHVAREGRGGRGPRARDGRGWCPHALRHCREGHVARERMGPATQGPCGAAARHPRTHAPSGCHHSSPHRRPFPSAARQPRVRYRVARAGLPPAANHRQGAGGATAGRGSGSVGVARPRPRRLGTLPGGRVPDWVWEYIQYCTVYSTVRYTPTASSIRWGARDHSDKLCAIAKTGGRRVRRSTRVAAALQRDPTRTRTGTEWTDSVGADSAPIFGNYCRLLLSASREDTLCLSQAWTVSMARLLFRYKTPFSRIC